METIKPMSDSITLQGTGSKGKTHGRNPFDMDEKTPEEPLMTPAPLGFFQKAKAWFIKQVSKFFSTARVKTAESAPSLKTERDSYLPQPENQRWFTQEPDGQKRTDPHEQPRGLREAVAYQKRQIEYTAQKLRDEQSAYKREMFDMTPPPLPPVTSDTTSLIKEDLIRQKSEADSQPPSPQAVSDDAPSPTTSPNSSPVSDKAPGFDALFAHFSQLESDKLKK